MLSAKYFIIACVPPGNSGWSSTTRKTSSISPPNFSLAASIRASLATAGLVVISITPSFPSSPYFEVADSFFTTLIDSILFGSIVFISKSLPTFIPSRIINGLFSPSVSASVFEGVYSFESVTITFVSLFSPAFTILNPIIEYSSDVSFPSNLKLNGRVYSVFDVSPSCVNGSHLGIALIIRMVSLSKDGSTPFTILGLLTVPSFSIIKLANTCPCIPFSFAICGYFISFLMNSTIAVKFLL